MLTGAKRNRKDRLLNANPFPAANRSSLVDASGAPQPAIVNIHIVLNQRVEAAESRLRLYPLCGWEGSGWSESANPSLDARVRKVNSVKCVPKPQRLVLKSHAQFSPY